MSRLVLISNREIRWFKLTKTCIEVSPLFFQVYFFVCLFFLNFFFYEISNPKRFTTWPACYAIQTSVSGV